MEKMTNDVAKIIIGYMRLGIDERKYVREFIEQFEQIDYSKKQEFRKSLAESLGPISQGTCPCCGR